MLSVASFFPALFLIAVDFLSLKIDISLKMCTTFWTRKLKQLVIFLRNCFCRRCRRRYRHQLIGKRVYRCHAVPGKTTTKPTLSGTKRPSSSDTSKKQTVRWATWHYKRCSVMYSIKFDVVFTCTAATSRVRLTTGIGTALDYCLRTQRETCIQKSSSHWFPKKFYVK